MRVVKIGFREKVELVICGILVVFAIFWFSGLRTTFQAWRDASSNLPEQRITLERYEKIAASFDRYGQRLKELSEEIAGAGNACYTDSSNNQAELDFLADVESAARVSRVRILTKSLLASNSLPGYADYRRMSVELVFEGSSRAFTEFLYLLGTSRRNLQVSALAVEANKQQGVCKGRTIVLGVAVSPGRGK